MRIGIVGGGAAAVSLLDSLLRRFAGTSARLDVTIYDGAAQLATGRAYRPDLDCALVNREAGYMSIRCRERDHFLRWLRTAPGYVQTQYASIQSDSFVPRRIYGEYLSEQLARCRADARQRGWTVTVVRQLAVGLAASPTELTVLSATGRTDHFNRLVVCPGTGEPIDPYRLAGAPGFHPDPYPLNMVLPAIATDAHVLVLGTGLSGVDVALGLIASGHRGPISMTSRHGLLPGVRAVQHHAGLRHLTSDAIGRLVAGNGTLRTKHVWQLIRAELAGTGVDLLARVDRPGGRPGSAADRLREDLSRLAGNPYQTIAMTALHEVRECVWAALPDSEKVLFLRRLHPHLKPFYNPMPPSTGRTLLAAMDGGQLAVVAGTVSVTASGGGSFLLQTGHDERKADAVVDTTRHGLARTGARAEPFLDSLVRSGLAVRNPHGGLRIDVGTGSLVPARPGQTRAPRAFALGDITSGDLYYAGSMYMINVRADVITSTLAQTCPPG
jgi:uncharacterized NAD(P)/FAD-binding protein YdhS